MKKFPIVVLSITLILVLVSIVLTFVGAFSGESGRALFQTGLFGIIFVPIFGWIMAATYNRIHGTDTVIFEADAEGRGEEATPEAARTEDTEATATDAKAEDEPKAEAADAKAEDEPTES